MERRYRCYHRLKCYCSEHDLCYQTLAEALRISKSAVARKINGYSDFTLYEVETLHLCFSIPYDIFLP